MTINEDQFLEVSKLREEIKSLQLQRVFLVLAALGSIISFFIANYTDISEILNPPPKISVIISDPFLKVNGVVEIHKLSSGVWGREIETSAKESEGWVSLSKGSYLVKLLLNNEIYFSEKIQLRRGDSRIVQFEDIISGAMRIKVSNKTKTVLPNTPLKLEINSSGRGYIWVFDITPEKQLELIYPQSGSKPSTHEILPESKYQIPDERRFGIFSGQTPGSESILFLVTATPKESLAINIASNFSGKTITKAQGGVVEVDWGVAVESYDVKLP